MIFQTPIVKIFPKIVKLQRDYCMYVLFLKNERDLEYWSKVNSFSRIVAFLVTVSVIISCEKTKSDAF